LHGRFIKKNKWIFTQNNIVIIININSFLDNLETILYRKNENIDN
jgi:hypothetical protein